MRTIQQGSGPALVLVPGIQGRWEYLGPAVKALANAFHVLTFPLCGERACDLAFDPATGIDNYIEQLRLALDEQHVERAVVCGVSFGGLIALRFAALHPERTTALVLASWLFGPAFLLETPFRVRREIAAAFPRLGDRVRFGARQLRTVIAAPLSPSRMAERALLISDLDVAADCARVRVPTLVVTGETALDFVVPTDGTSDYARLIPGARHAVLERTGHLGTITRPDEFALLVARFVSEHERRGSGAGTGSSLPRGRANPGERYA